MIRILTSLVAILTVTSIQSQTNLKETPKLVIGITIDQLRGDYLELFEKTFSDKGFKRLLNEGTVFQNMAFDFPNLNAASAIATIYTGTSPFYHGIVDSKTFFSDKNAESSIFEDNDYLGNYTREKLSPRSLLVGTITDELKIASQGKSDIFSLAPNSYQAIPAAGHLANGAYWIEDYSGKWSSSTYYGDMYWSIEQDNRTNIFSNQSSTLIWKPLLANDRYNQFAYAVPSPPFAYQFNQQSNPYPLLKESPYANENITQSVMRLIERDDMGKRISPDFLSITYYAGNYSASDQGDYSYAIQDTYARLDKEIATLIEHLEKTVGLQNILMFVTSTGYYDSNSKYPIDKKYTSKFFYPNRCEALLNMYLMAIYGKEQWVERYYNDQIYLNHKLIESKKINLEEILNKTVEFVLQFAGVQDAVTSIQLLTGRTDPEMRSYRNMLKKGYSGDIFVKIQSGYQVSYEDVGGDNNKPRSEMQRELAIISPVIFFGGSIKAEKIKRTIKATEIAPTICRILRIRSPNAAKDQPLPELF